MRHHVPLARSYIREIVFGLEDSLVSTVGAVTGMAAGFTYPPLVVFAGTVLIVAEAFSMAAGSYLSSKVAGAVVHAEGEGDLLHPVLGAGIMGISYIVAGFVPILPYIFAGDEDRWQPLASVSIGLTLLSLLLLGVWSVRYTKRSLWKSVLEMVLVGGIAIALGYAVARLLTSLHLLSL
ncbi:VIT1/CCC1 transporter family protein [Candidatus Uhrbacteria bacterium]|nr:VIT1/CCC1 transporter family protein [Candidatus Uhrbacteria bacterium]